MRIAVILVDKDSAFLQFLVIVDNPFFWVEMISFYDIIL